MGGEDLEARELEKCIDAFGTEIYRFCIKLCMDKENAEDLYQQTFLKALESDMKLTGNKIPKRCFFLSPIIFGKVTREKMPDALLLPPAVSWMMKTKIYCIRMKMWKKKYSGRN